MPRNISDNRFHKQPLSLKLQSQWYPLAMWWAFERGLNSKGLKPKSPWGPDLVVCPAMKVNTAPQGEHRKGWVCSSQCGTSLRPIPTEGWSHSANAMKQNLPALNRSSVMDPRSQGGRWDAPCLLPEPSGSQYCCSSHSHTNHSEKGSLSQSRSGTGDMAGLKGSECWALWSPLQQPIVLLLLCP